MNIKHTGWQKLTNITCLYSEFKYNIKLFRDIRCENATKYIFKYVPLKINNKQIKSSKDY